jgi:hypothetical protein
MRITVGQRCSEGAARQQHAAGASETGCRDSGVWVQTAAHGRLRIVRMDGRGATGTYAATVGMHMQCVSGNKELHESTTVNATLGYYIVECCSLCYK